MMLKFMGYGIASLGCFLCVVWYGWELLLILFLLAWGMRVCDLAELNKRGNINLWGDKG